MQQFADVASQAEEVAEREKRAGAERVDKMAKAVHGAADELGKEMPQAAELFHAAASRLEHGAEALRDRNLRDLVASFSEMGRREPLAIFGGAVVSGFAISRFLKSSSKNSRREE